MRSGHCWGPPAAGTKPAPKPSLPHGPAAPGAPVSLLRWNESRLLSFLLRGGRSPPGPRALTVQHRRPGHPLPWELRGMTWMHPDLQPLPSQTSGSTPVVSPPSPHRITIWGPVMVLKRRSEVKCQRRPESRWLIVGANQRLMALTPVSAEMTRSHRPVPQGGREAVSCPGAGETPPADGGRGRCLKGQLRAGTLQLQGDT